MRRKVAILYEIIGKPYGKQKVEKNTNRRCELENRYLVIK